MSFDVSSIIDDAHRRDQWGRMLVVPPPVPGREDRLTEPIGYTRVTTVAKTHDDGGGLAPWEACMAITGMLRRPGLRAKWEQLYAETGGDPWYSSKASKTDAKRLVQECKAAGGSSDRAEQGTSLHALTAMVDVGRTPAGLSPQTEADVTAYVNGLIDAGITVPHIYGEPAVEVTVVLDEWRVAGTADRIVNVPGFDRPMIADLKTGADLGYSWQAIAVQLAAYAHANDIYVQGADPNGSADVRVPMPDVDWRHGLIIHLPAGEARCELWVVDLAAGWEAFASSVQTRAWRTRRDLAVRLPRPGVVAAAVAAAPPLLSAVPSEARPAGATDQAPGVVRDPFVNGATFVLGEPVHPALAAPSVAEPFTTGAELAAELRAWRQARVDVIGALAAARADLVRSWPPGVPSLRAAADHSAAQLAAIDSVLDDVEARHSIPFGPTRPGQARTAGDSVERLLQIFPNTTKEPQS